MTATLLIETIFVLKEGTAKSLFRIFLIQNIRKGQLRNSLPDIPMQLSRTIFYIQLDRLLSSYGAIRHLKDAMKKRRVHHNSAVASIHS